MTKVKKFKIKKFFDFFGSHKPIFIDKTIKLQAPITLKGNFS